MVSQATYTNGEYDFVERPSSDYFCPVTFELLTDPRQTNSCCGRHLSRAVAEKLEAEGKPCPLCKKAPLKTADDLFFKRKVLELQVRCSHKRQGCAWVGELRALKGHLEVGSVEGQCQYVNVECPLKCGQRVRRRDQEKHKSNECVKRLFFCEHCGYESAYENVTEKHWPKCQQFPVECPNRCTKKKMKRQFLQRHLDEDCPQQVIDCKFSFAGCPAKVKRQSMCEHLEQSKGEHLEAVSMYARSMKDELTALQIAFTQIAPKRVFVPPPDMVIKNFEKLKKEKTEWYSPAFYTHVGGYKMCLQMDAVRWEDGLSLSLYMMRGEFDSHLKWPFRGVITVQLINQVGGGKHLKFRPVEISDATGDGYYTVFQRWTEHDRSSMGWGMKKFISHADLYKPEEGKEYLKNDTLKFRVTEVVVASQ